jgi:hypothetical protein
VRRRRFRRGMMGTTVIVDTNSTNPSIVQGQPVYGANQYGGAPVYNNYYNQPYNGLN